MPTLAQSHDRHVRRPLLGLQCRDVATGRVVDDGLRAVLLDALFPARRIDLPFSRRGVFALHALPGPGGLRGFDDDAWSSPAETGRHSVLVDDTLGRYLPVLVDVTLPHAGLFGPPARTGSPAAVEPHVPLFSAATRPVPQPMAALRTMMRRAADDSQPVAWAHLELWLGTELLAEGCSDMDGQALLVFPLPRPREPGLRDSPGTVAARRRWDLELRAHWTPRTPGRRPPPLETLLAQPAVGLLQTRTPAAPLAPLTLTAGDTLVAASTGVSWIHVAA